MSDLTIIWNLGQPSYSMLTYHKLRFTDIAKSPTYFLNVYLSIELRIIIMCFVCIRLLHNQVEFENQPTWKQFEIELGLILVKAVWHSEYFSLTHCMLGDKMADFNFDHIFQNSLVLDANRLEPIRSQPVCNNIKISTDQYSIHNWLNREQLIIK